jgi:hypothetical protein
LLDRPATALHAPERPQNNLLYLCTFDPAGGVNKPEGPRSTKKELNNPDIPPIDRPVFTIIF